MFRSKKKRWIAGTLLAGLILVTLLSACGPMAGDQGAIVNMSNLEFTPQEVTIPAGATVTWQNSDLPEHTVTAGTRGNPTGLFDATVASGEEFSFTFDQPGTYEYFCTIHPDMNGVVIVE